MRAMMPELQVANTSGDLMDADPDEGPILLLANVEHSWWHKIWHTKPPHILACSPPCQPWSEAGHGSGLESADGRLLLQLASIMRVVRVKVVCLEEVVGFSRHADYPAVMQAWHEAGYRRLFESTLQLSEVLPTRRPRSMFVFVHESVSMEETLKFRNCMWQPVRRPSLGGMRAIFEHLPEPLLRPCLLTPELLQVYLDPWFLPLGQGTSALDARRYRLCSPAQQARCFMACYHRQHELPAGMLTRGGILCSLLHERGESRFFAAPEIACCHGAQRVVLISHDDQVAMRLLGNSLAVPQAMLTLAHALLLFPQGHKVDPQFAVHHCLQTRLHAGNSALFCLPQGWALIGHDALGDLLADRALRRLLEKGMATVSVVFHEMQILCSEGTDREPFVVRSVHFSAHIKPEVLLESLQVKPAGPVQYGAPAVAGHIRHQVVAAELEPLRFSAQPCVRAQREGPILLCTSGGLIAIKPAVPDVYHQLKWAFDRCRSSEQPAVVCMTPYGAKVQQVEDFPPITFVAGSANDIHFHEPRLDQAHIGASIVAEDLPRLYVGVPAQFAFQWWLQLPYHLLECLGWAADCDDPPQQVDSTMLITLQPASPQPALSTAALKLYLRDLAFQSQLLAMAQNPRELLVGPLQVQIEARSLCRVLLPEALTPNDVEAAWRTACHALGTWPGCRIFSGPRRLEAEASLGELLSAEGFHVKCQSQLPLLTIMPEVRGGGVKDENTAFAKSKMATLMLERGVSLEATQATVDAVLPKIGTAACLHALRQSDTQAQWSQLSKAAQSKGQQLPSGDNRNEKAAQRIQQAVRRQRLHQQRPVRACDFQLQPDTWCGMDGQVVPVLDEISADATGVVLMDASQANAQDIALLRNMGSEALCLVVPGHRCPDCESCSGRTSVPVLHRQTGHQHLIAACYHNVGDTDITPHLQHGTRVDVEDTICCSFTMCQEDFANEQQWRDLAAAPVRSVIEAFRARGVQDALHHPWARAYRAGGKTSMPHLCDQFVFYAKVPQGQLKAMLQQSGFNKVYVVPRTWDRQLLSGWSVVWLPVSRHDVEKQALLVPEQHGLVRGKNKFGLRVPSSAFRKVFVQLRPGADVPDSLEVTETWKVGPFPAAASAEAVREWSRRMNWPTRVIKSLGPQFWLLGASSAPPDATMLFNTTPVLASAVKGRDVRPPIVQAGGPLPRSDPGAAVTKAETDPWLESDPWSSYRASQAAPQSRSPPGLTAPAPLDSATAGRLVQQDSRISELEKGLQQLRDEQVQGLGSGLRQDFQAWTTHESTMTCDSEHGLVPDVQALVAVQADVISLSETSAVARAQKVTAAALRKHGFKAHWGDPVQPHCRAESDRPSMRGLAAGVGLLSRLPSRRSSVPLPPEASATCRLAEAFVRLGALEIRVLTIYGVPMSEPDAKDRTNELLRQAFLRASQNPIPCIVAGDFNMRPFDCPAGQAFQAQGYQDVFDLYRHRAGQDLPPTCKGSTRHDTAILHPVLARLWREAWVLQRQLFDSHEPLCFSLCSCHARPCTRVWRLPKPWSQLGVDRLTFAEAFRSRAPQLQRQAALCQNTDDVDAVLRAFSEAAEAAAEAALRKQHELDPVSCPNFCLPRAFRGRCQPRRHLKQESACRSRPDWSGGYNPDVEVTSVLGRLKVRQVRRLTTLRSGLAKLQLMGATTRHDLRSQLQREWRAVQHAKGYPPFSDWLLNVACFSEFYVELPPLEWLTDVVAYCRYDCDALVRQEARLRRDTFLLRVNVDAEVGGSRQGFAAMRAPPNPPFTEVPCTVAARVQAVHTTSPLHGCPREFVVPEHALYVHGSAELDGVPCQVLEAGDRYVRLQGTALPDQIQLSQSYTACTAPELHAAFRSFWAPLWQRDSGAASSDLSSWPDFQAVLARSTLSPDAGIDIQCSPQQWRDAIKRMPARKSTGICGWAPSDLKLLSDEALSVLSAVFTAAVRHGLPQHILRARVCVLAKVLCPDHIKQSRPITIFSTLYRVWASIVTRSLLHSWKDTFPSAVAGSMPGKSCREVSLKQQHLIELSLMGAAPRVGFSLDIVKCFNQLGWPPVQVLMTRLGAPQQVISFWLDCLCKLERHSSFLGDLSAGIPCSNGAPEGDPLSVAALAVVCCFAEEACRTDMVAFDTYVDNWGWSSNSRAAIELAIPKATGFLSALSLPVDWAKSYTWATSAQGRKWWQTAHNRVFPEGTKVPLVSEVRDLGVSFKYDGRPHAASRSSRLQDGLERLDRLRQQPRSPCLKASMVQRGVWTACLYGAEGHLFSQAEISQLRGRAARAIVGQHKVLSPFLALSALSAHCQDPELYCIEQQLQLLRRTCSCDPDLAASLLELATQAQPPRSYQGPATALRLALDRLGLQITSAGVIKGRDNTWVDVTSCHKTEIRRLLRRTWALHVQEQVAHRNGLAAAPPVHTEETGRLLQQFKINDQLVLARHITGAFSSAAARHKWDPSETPQCALCGQLQTKEHKFLHCPALAGVRADFTEVLQEVVATKAYWIHAPFAAAPPDLEVNNLIFATRALPCPTTEIGTYEEIGSRPFVRLFTDGSCRHPTVPEASLAAFAVVLDTSTCDEAIPGLLAKWRETAMPPTEFRVVCQGSVPGLQSINRAEVCALIQAIRVAQLLSAPSAEIWTDSAFAIREWERACAGQDCTWPDLGAMLARLRHFPVRLRKVASHQDLNKLWGLEQWVAAGNEAADVAAKAAVGREMQCVRDIADAANDFLKDQRRLLKQFWTYLARLSFEEARLLRSSGTGTEQTEDELFPRGPPIDKWLALNTGLHQTWNVGIVQREWLLACSWPPWFTVPLWEWLRTLEWAVHMPTGRAPCGVAYVELLVAFVCTTGICPPAGLDVEKSHEAVLTDNLQIPTTLRQLNHSLVEAVRQLERLSHVALWPPRRGKVFSLRALNCREPRIGLTLRPFFRDPDQVAEILCQVIQTSSVAPLRKVALSCGNRPFAPDEALQRAWNCVNASQRANMGLRQNIITRSVAVSAWGRGYRWQQALGLLHSIGQESLEANVFTFTATSSAAEKAQRWRTAGELLCVMGCQSVQPNVQAFSALCSAWAENGSWCQAAALVQVMQTAGPLPNQFTFNGLARACQRGDSWTHALRLFTMLDEGRGLQPDLLTLDATIKAFESGGQMRLLPHLADSLQFVRTADGNQEALVLELLGHALLASQAAAFARRRVKPALRRLQGWLQPSDQDAVLAAQFNLGELHTAHVLRKTSLSLRSASSCAWLPSARRAARATGRSSASEPVAKELPASMALCSGKQAVRCRPFGHGGSRRYEDMKLLMQVYVEHDRLWHSERHALLSLLSQLLTRRAHLPSA
ncbi:unnamed protein product [Symbiodinium sp. CCMP2592]|nr:unnamed protein product [Symbiodinium sp. CCMP2592]